MSGASRRDTLATCEALADSIVDDLLVMGAGGQT